MATRSRKGCIDCKQAKVKCDEVHPHCGTCARRRRQCSGYANNSRASAAPRNSGSASRSVGLHHRRSSVASSASMASSSRASVGGDTWLVSPSSSSSSSTADYMRSMILEASTKANAVPPARGPALIPLSEILAADKPLIEVYFMRHPSEMIISNDFFISEMNGAAIALLQQSPTAVGDALAAIGENYVADSPDSALVSNRKTRLLSRLRLINEEESSPELVLMLLLALCGVELVDPRSDGGATTLSALIDNVSMVLAFHTRQGKPLSPMAKYFARGVARQDLLISLARMQRTKIDPRAWLDDYSLSHADRVMGLTTTLAPILSRLAALAEDVQLSMPSYGAITEGDVTEPDNAAVRRNDLREREASLRAQLTSWRPVRDGTMSIAMSRTFLLHAYSWRAAALLYLFRLFNRPGHSPEADVEALGLAYEVMVHICGSPQDIKLSLWPLFVAACELESPEDRAHATRLFDDVCFARPIVTARRTRAFVVDTVWPARDSGANWDWMRFARSAPIPL
ncbi:fungal-specific transcription factor domain-containing protein [Aspergillus pseudoustus]|uniref:Fungal-specific transcription factor domain-containing protein n=1 Tax=Aspergillus pseudoustus TaxID=1810923 RepID=A0ABR4JIR1_9EURO